MKRHVTLFFFLLLHSYTIGIYSMENQSYITIADEQDNDCGICIEPLEKPGYDVITLACKQNHGKHAFHFACILEWYNKHPDTAATTCPLCRDFITIAQEPEHRVFATLQYLREETSTIKEAHECNEVCMKGFSLLDTLFACCLSSRRRN